MGKLIELICIDMSEQDNVDRSEVKRTMDTATGPQLHPHHNRT
jgi:hypothetical protein